MNPVGVYLGGEGPNELGSRAAHPVYQIDKNPGVLQTLLSKVQPEGWRVAGAVTWKKIRKYRARGTTPGEEQNVLGLVDAAGAARAQVVAFFRDADGDPARPAAITRGIEQAIALFPELEIIGGTAVPVLEGWILAILGVRGTEQLSKAGAQSRLADRGIGSKDTRAMVETVQSCSIERLPKDAESLRIWLARAGEVLPRLVEEAGRVQRAPEEQGSR